MSNRNKRIDQGGFDDVTDDFNRFRYCTAICGYVVFKLNRAGREIDRLLKDNEQLVREKAVSDTQVKRYETRKQHEENSRNADRDTLIDGLHKSGDLRD